MIESRICDAGWNDDGFRTEQWILAARDYLEVSDDLRPRVLEAARARRGKRRTMWLAAVSFAGLLVAAGAWRGLHRWSEPWSIDCVNLTARWPMHQGNAPYLRDRHTAQLKQSSDAWEMANSFAALRRQQASSLRRAR